MPPKADGSLKPSSPSTQERKAPSLRAPRPLGGVFSPVAQFPGACYADVLSTSKDAAYVPKPKEITVAAKNKIIVRTKEPMQVMQAHSYSHAILLVEVENAARMDKKALRDAGVDRVQVLTSGILAARFATLQAEKIAQDPEGIHDSIDIIFCHARFHDMSALQWLDLARQHAFLAGIPMVAITGSVEEAQILGQISDGFDGVLMRPYNQEQVRRTLAEVQATFTPHHVEDSVQNTAAFAATLKQLESYQEKGGAKAELYFREGLRHVKEKAWDAGIQALTKALYAKDVKGEAEYTLAAAWQGKQDFEKQTYYLSEACTTFVRTQKWARARLAYSQLLRVLPTAENPFIRLAESHIRSQECKEAAGLLVLGLDLGNACEVVTRLARACLFTENPPFTLGQIEKAFTAPELQKLSADIAAEVQRLSDIHAANLQQYRKEYETLKAKAKAMPLQESVLALQQKFSQAQSRAEHSAENKSQKAYNPASYTGNNEDVTGVIPGMPTLIQEQKASKSKEGAPSKLLPEDSAIMPLGPLDEEALGVELFSAFPRLNDMATVVKVTWKLMSGKKE